MGPTGRTATPLKEFTLAPLQIGRVRAYIPVEVW